jgi:PTH1 family peptidyl-tRNA hydrolase
MKYLIIGLGNPGDKYENTRHNIGFKVLDHFLSSLDDPWSTQKLGDVSRIKFKGRTLVFLKPSTFMNLSGKAVNYWMQKEKIPVENIMVITDDIALPFGKLRMKGKGSDGGHNGLKDIIAVLNSSTFARLRFGVGNEFSKGRQVDYVLGEWSAEEEEKLDERMKICSEFIKGFVTIGLQQTMNNWNNK